jgi:hypothetical protein
LSSVSPHPSSLLRTQHPSSLPSESHSAPLPPPPPPPIPTRSVPRIGPRTTRRSQSPGPSDKDSHHSNSFSPQHVTPSSASSSTTSLYSSHPQAYLSPFLPNESEASHSPDNHHLYPHHQRRHPDSEEEEEEYEDHYLPGGDEEDDEAYFLEGSSEFLSYSHRGNDQEGGEEYDSYDPNYSYHPDDYEGNEYQGDGRYLPYPPHHHHERREMDEYEEDDEPDQYPLPSEDLEDDGYYENDDDEDDRGRGRRGYEEGEVEGEVEEAGHGVHGGDWNDEEYSEAYEIENIHSSSSSTMIGMYASPPPPLPPPPSPAVKTFTSPQKKKDNQMIFPQHLDLL